MATTTIRPFLLFEGNAEAAIDFYVSIFEGAQVLEMLRYGANESGAEGSVKRGVFSIANQTILCTDSVVKHGFTFTPSMSLFVQCQSESEIIRVYEALAERGTLLMPLGNYGFSKQFAWINDRFGVSWQMNLGEVV